MKTQTRAEYGAALIEITKAWLCSKEATDKVEHRTGPARGNGRIVGTGERKSSSTHTRNDNRNDHDEYGQHGCTRHFEDRFTQLCSDF